MAEIRVKEAVKEVVEKVIEPEKIVMTFTREEAEVLGSIASRFSAFGDQPLLKFYHRFVDAGINTDKYSVRMNDYDVLLIEKKR